MDDWNKFPGNNDEVTESPVNFTMPEKKKKTKTKDKYVTKKFFIFTLITAMIFSAAIGAGAFAFSSACLLYTSRCV